jgi:hypothetical protein
LGGFLKKGLVRPFYRDSLSPHVYVVGH